MKTKTIPFKTTAAAAVLTCSLLGPVTTSAAPGTLADSPLFLSNAVEPNILFLIDDSGSMDWSLMTRETRGIMAINGCDFFHSFPAPDNQSSWPDIVPTEASLVARGISAPYGGVWRAWNKDYNRVYYDPAVTYTPWPGEDTNGNLYTSASPTAALYNPYLPATGSLDLTSNSSYTSDYCSGGSFTVTYHPARYNVWTDTDGDKLVDANDAHTLVEIKPTTLVYGGSAARRDCAVAPVCTYAEEIQNFANWFQYYRKREGVAKQAYGQVIATASGSRMGLMTINHNGNVDTTISSMNADPRSGNKGNLLDHLYQLRGDNNTPLRDAYDDAGRYLACKSNSVSGFGTCPALPANSGGACQQNFNVMMTDGFYNGSFSGIGNEDGNNDSTWDTGNSGPYGDSRNNTLGDIAMEYYETDLRPSTPNDLNPPPGGIDENTAQHMVTYSVAFGVNGELTANPPNTTDPFTWPNPNNDPRKIDDLRHAAFNGRGEFLSAQNPTELIEGLRSALSSIQGRIGSSASVAFNTGSLSTNSEVYLALFNSELWNGNLLAFDLDPNSGAISSTPNWAAGNVLNARDLSTRPRTLLTYDGTDGIPFQWANLTTAQKNDLRTDPSGTLGVDAVGMARLGFVRGDRGCEFSSSGTCYYNDGTNTFNTKSLRERGGRLGDIVHSGPVFAGAPESGWPDVPPFPHATGQTYTEFKEANASRTGIVFVGGNDGMLHGFLQTTGEEILGYIPNALFSTTATDGLHNLASPAYTHRYDVDLTASIADAYVKTTAAGSVSWKTVLIGGLRGGGRGLFALDITNPSALAETTTAAAKTVMWEFTDADDPDLGHSFSRPSIVPLEGPSNTVRWGAVFGNGYNDQGSGEAKLFIVLLEGGLDGTWTAGVDYLEISTGVGTTSNRNGLSTPAVIDSDGDGRADRVYAGDLQGSMWAFDISGSNVSNWGVAYKQGAVPKPLFDAPANQQVTSTPVVVRNTSIPTSVSNTPNTLVIFGTGQYLTKADITTTNTQSVYGVWDHGQREIVQADMISQTVGMGSTSGSVVGRTLTNNNIDYSIVDGWYMNLPDSGERLITDPVIRGDVVFFNTMTPDSNPCNSGGSGWLMAAKWLNGGAPDEVAFDLNGDNQLDALDEIGGASPVGMEITGIATSPVNLANKRYTSTTETTGGSSIQVTEILEPEGLKTGRLSWEELTP